jgi:predicted ATPase/DNA-binding SARP family transcriptional activator
MPAVSAQWRIKLLGDLRVFCSDRVVERFRTRKAAELLAYIACFAARSHSRDGLADLLWPGNDPETGRNRLSNALSSLRRSLALPGGLPGSLFLANPSSVRLNTAVATTDVAGFEADLEAAARASSPGEKMPWLARAVATYRGELLAGFQASWILAERERLAERYFDALAQCITHLARTGDPGGALEYAQQGLRIDPLREEIHREIIRLYADAGQYEAAHRHYAELERLLQAELNAAPAAATRAFLASPGEAVGWSVSPLEPTEHPPRPIAGLPAPLTRFIGREEELGQLRRLLAVEGRRLVTLTGVGGSGKTRLALEAAQRMAAAWRDAVFWAPLADLDEPRRIIEVVRDRLGLSPSAGIEPMEQVTAMLRRRPALLLLDNYEHLVEGGALVVQSLLECVPSLTCLVTSRRRLGLSGECEFPVSPLPEGDPSIRLFLDRARSVLPGFQATGERREAIAAICRRLEGLPLAIELAAARVGIFTPAQILAQLAGPAHASSLLTSRQQDTPPRHRTLRATIDWSYNLLTPELRRVFARFSVFRGGATLDAVAAVCGGVPATLEAISSLVDQGLVLRLQNDGVEPRFGMLETIREYALERLTVGGKIEETRRRHALYCLKLVEQTGCHRIHDRTEWLDRLQQEHDNVCAALAWSMEADAELALRLAGGMGWYWNHRGPWGEGRRWLTEALARTDPAAGTASRARALQSLGVLAWCQVDYTATCAAQRESVTIWRELGDSANQGNALANLGWALYFLGDYPGARATLEAGAAVARAGGHDWSLPPLLNGLTHVALKQGRLAEARILSEEAVAVARDVGDALLLAWAVGGFATVQLAEGKISSARRSCEESLVRAREAGHLKTVADVLSLLATIEQRLGNTAGMRACCEEWLEIEEHMGNPHRAAQARQALSHALQIQGFAEAGHDEGEGASGAL